MKKLFLFTILLLLIITISLFVFLLTFDANRYKDFLIEKIEAHIKKDIRIGNISLNVFPRIAISMQGISIKDVNETWDNAILEAGSVAARVKLLPLMRRDIQIEHLLVRGLDVSIRDDIRIDVTEAVLKNISLYGPIHIDANLSVFGRGAENIKLKADLYPDFEGKKHYIKNLNIRIDLDRFNLTGALNALGKFAASQQVIGKEIAGELTITSGKMYLEPEKVYNSNIYAELSNGTTDIFPVKGGLRNIELKAEMDRGDVILQKLTGDIAGGDFLIKGSVKDILFRQYSVLDIVLNDIAVGMLFADLAPGEPYLEGTVDIDITGSAEGLMPEAILDTLTSQGTIKLDKAVLRNINILTVALEELDMLPGLVQKLKARLPKYYRELLKQNYTAFAPIETEFNIRDKKMLFKKFVIESDAFYLVGNGYLGMNRDINVSSNLFIPRDLSEAFIIVVDALRYLQNGQGMITMPIDVYGTFPDISVRPDMDYVIQRLAVSKGQELLERIFKKKEPEEIEGQPETGSEEQVETQKKQKEIEPAEALIRTIFDIISAPQDTKEE